LTDELLTHYEAVITRLTLLPSHGGRFELRADGALLFSKTESRRHLEPGEGVRLPADKARKLEHGARSGY